MGEESSAEGGGDAKPDAKQNNDHSRNPNRRGKKKKNNTYVSDKEDKKFTGVTDKIGVFTAQANQGRAAGTAQYNETVQTLVSHAADNYNSRCSQSIAKGKLILPTRPKQDEYDMTTVEKDGKNVDELTETGKMMYMKAIERYEKEKETVQESLRRMYQLVWNNCA